MLSIYYPFFMDKLDVPQDPWTQFVLGVFRLNGLIVEAGESISGSVGQSSARWQVLGSAYRPQTVADIARALGISRQGVQRVTNTLIKEGLVQSMPHPSDQRTYLIELTVKGRTILTQIYAKQLAWSQIIENVVNLDQMKQATELLVQLGDALEPEVQKIKS